MKILIAIMSIVIFNSGATVAQAQPSLEDVMKVIGEQFKSLGKAAQTGAFTAEHLENVETLELAAADSALIYPDTADTFELKVEYSQLQAQMMKNALLLEVEIESVLNKNNNPQDINSALGIMKEMGKIRKKAHQLFKLSN